MNFDQISLSGRFVQEFGMWILYRRTKIRSVTAFFLMHNFIRDYVALSGLPVTVPDDRPIPARKLAFMEIGLDVFCLK